MSCGPGEKEGMSGGTLCFTVHADRDVWICCKYILEQFWEYGKLWLWAKSNQQWDQQISTVTFPSSLEYWAVLPWSQNTDTLLGHVTGNRMCVMMCLYAWLSHEYMWCICMNLSKLLKVWKYRCKSKQFKVLSGLTRNSSMNFVHKLCWQVDLLFT